MNRILFHSLTIPPDQVSTGKLVADIASKFKEKNLNIKILASTPQYRFDSKNFSDNGLKQIGKNKYVVSSLKDKSIYFFELDKNLEISNMERIDIFERIRDLKYKNNQFYKV